MNTFRQYMSWMHTWTGLVFGWVLFFMFLTGSASYYDTELDRWMQPEQPAPVTIDDTAELLQVGLDHAMIEAPEADAHFVRIPTSRSYSPYIFTSWNGVDEDGDRYFGRAELLADGSVVPDGRDTGGGQALYRMHWAFHYIPASIGEVIAGIMAFFMFAAIVSGIIMHKKIFVDFFTLRFGKGQRSWLDAHNVTSVMSLPYQIMITFTGLIFVVTTLFIPVFLAQYAGSENIIETITEEMFDQPDVVERTGIRIEMADLGPLVVETQSRLGDEPVTQIRVLNPGDETARINVRGSFAHTVLRETAGVWFDGETGDFEKYSPRKFEGGHTVINTMEGLHEGLFAGSILRIVFFVSGLMGAVMVSTGLVHWTRKRRTKLRGNAKAERNLVVIERMNVGVVAGLSVAIAAYFWANRLLPLDLAGRGEWEIHTIFLVWLVMVVHGLVRKPENGWTEQLWLAAAAFIILPVLNGLTSSIHLINTLPLPGRSGDLALAGVDLWFLVIGLGFAWAARISAKRSYNSVGAAQSPMGVSTGVAAE
ncbi:MAG: PepSY-associated TM helix domain-containing protein [Henriciella sp.]